MQIKTYNQYTVYSKKSNRINMKYNMDVYTPITKWQKYFPDYLS